MAHRENLVAKQAAAQSRKDKAAARLAKAAAKADAPTELVEFAPALPWWVQGFTCQNPNHVRQRSESFGRSQPIRCEHCEQCQWCAPLTKACFNLTGKKAHKPATKVKAGRNAHQLASTWETLPDGAVIILPRAPAPRDAKTGIGSMADLTTRQIDAPRTEEGRRERRLHGEALAALNAALPIDVVGAWSQRAAPAYGSDLQSANLMLTVRRYLRGVCKVLCPHDGPEMMKLFITPVFRVAIVK